ncbi:HvfC/BufC N-terminal domain-containing protein [Novosphingobium lentum]|uniref:HvfC/BufC N-terminal domain-containing protein n=1 Tax=Novosphingobium lentum TaxID=145287 RepID=UPI00083069D8|nr:DNA-binding domain-containing protein [Novosphingobium lentum]
MADLATFQRELAAALDRPQQGPLAIYRNTVLLGAVDALAANYPVCRRLVGDEGFAPLATEHAVAHPPEHAVLAHYGAHFARWLADHPVSEELPYLADVAQCERLWVEALHAADAPMLEPADLQTLGPEAFLATRLALHPATRFAWLATPAMPIWLAHQDDDCAECAPDWTGFGALFTRPALVVVGHALDQAQYALLVRLADEESLGTASAAVAHEFPDADLAGAFALLLTSGAFAAMLS